MFRQLGVHETPSETVLRQRKVYLFFFYFNYCVDTYDKSVHRGWCLIGWLWTVAVDQLDL